MEDKILSLTEELTKTYEELFLLLDISEKISSTLSSKEIVDLTFKKCKELIPFCKVFIFIKDKEKWNLEIAEDEIDDELKFRILEKLQKEPKTFILPIAEKKEILASPLLGKQNIQGAIILVNKINYNFTAGDKKFIYTISSIVGTTLENAKLYENLREEKEKVETIIQNVNSAILTFDANNICINYNKAVLGLLKVEEEIFKNKTYKEIFDFFEDKKILNFLRDAEESHKDFVDEEINFTLFGELLKLKLTLIKLRNEINETYLKILTIENLTEIIRIQKIAVWQDIARKLAHEVKNPLTPIRLNAEILQDEKLQKMDNYKETVIKFTNTIINEVDRLKTLIEEFHDFGRLPLPKLELQNINSLLEEILFLYQNLPANIKIKSSFSKNLQDILIDKNQIKQVLINLIKNAIEAMSGGGEINITTDMEDEFIKIEIADTGEGISQDILDKIFDPYFTTKKTGSGLGLSLVYRIIKDHRGDIKVKSKIGEGTIFNIYLPKQI